MNMKARYAVLLGVSAIGSAVGACSDVPAAAPDLQAVPADSVVIEPARDATASAVTSVDGASDTLDAARPDSVPPRFENRIVHLAHRAIPNVMFGGWGPHLGHLLQRRTPSGSETWFIDDACEVGTCDVLRNRRLDYFKLGSAGFQKVTTLELPAGVQQNTASLVLGDDAYSYGVDVASGRLVECKQNLVSGPGICTGIQSSLESGSNYVGAAVSPKGYRLAWLTHVVDGGGGAFSYFVNYSSGWNGPRRGGIGGYNDVSYINVAFGRNGSADEFTMHGQLVSGLAPNWSFFGATGAGNLANAAPVTWANDLASPSADPVESTNDIAIDPVTSDEHVIARTRSGAAAYYFRARGQSIGPAVRSFSKSYRARLLFLADGTLALVRSDGGRGLVVQLAKVGDRTVGKPVDWSALPELRPALPAGYEDLYAIYPAASVYQRFAPEVLEVALVGSVRQHEVLHVRMVTNH
jgi:hypothetical protein